MIHQSAQGLRQCAVCYVAQPSFDVAIPGWGLTKRQNGQGPTAPDQLKPGWIGDRVSNLAGPLCNDLPCIGQHIFRAQRVAVSRYDLSTRVISAGRYKLLGFVGECTYRILDQASPFTPELNMLADFALFSGVGMKKGQGMGQTRRIRER